MIMAFQNDNFILVLLFMICILRWKNVDIILVQKYCKKWCRNIEYFSIEAIGRFQTLFRENWNFGKMFGASDFSLKITPKSRI